MAIMARYRRKEYRDIPERNMSLNHRGGGGSRSSSTIKNRGIGNIVSGDSSSKMKLKGGGDLSIDISRDSSSESMIGLSLRERDLTLGGGHFEQQEQKQGIQKLQSGSFDSIEKPKKK